MKKNILAVVLIMSVFLAACGNSNEQKHEDVMPPADTSNGVSAATSVDSINGNQSALTYICPCGGCPEVKEPHPGKCPKCEMDLVEDKN